VKVWSWLKLESDSLLVDQSWTRTEFSAVSFLCSWNARFFRRDWQWIWAICKPRIGFLVSAGGLESAMMRSVDRFPYLRLMDSGGS